LRRSRGRHLVRAAANDPETRTGVGARRAISQADEGRSAVGVTTVSISAAHGLSWRVLQRALSSRVDVQDLIPEAQMGDQRVPERRSSRPSLVARRRNMAKGYLFHDRNHRNSARWCLSRGDHLQRHESVFGSVRYPAVWRGVDQEMSMSGAAPGSSSEAPQDRCHSVDAR